MCIRLSDAIYAQCTLHTADCGVVISCVVEIEMLCVCKRTMPGVYVYLCMSAIACNISHGQCV